MPSYSAGARLCVVIATAILGWSRPAQAQRLTLLFQDGHVTVDAQDVSLSTILAEWSRIGGATVISAERIADARVTLTLAAVPESEALDILLRGTCGYLIAPRVSPAPGTAVFDRIMILPTTCTATAAAAPAPPTPAPSASIDALDEVPGSAVDINEPPADPADNSGPFTPIRRTRDPERRVD